MDQAVVTSTCCPLIATEGQGSGVSTSVNSSHSETSSPSLCSAGSAADQVVVSDADLTSVSTNVSTVSLFGEHIVSLEIDGTKR